MQQIALDAFLHTENSHGEVGVQVVEIFSVSVEQ